MCPLFLGYIKYGFMLERDLIDGRLSFLNEQNTIEWMN
jgi:hypothetical protein